MRKYTKLEGTKKELEDRAQLFKELKKLMETPPKPDRNKQPPRCPECPYFRPEFRYRKCLYGTCPMGKTRNKAYRKKPLREEKIALGVVI